LELQGIEDFFQLRYLDDEWSQNSNFLKSLRKGKKLELHKN
jgi:hypothetical protein